MTATTTAPPASQPAPAEPTRQAARPADGSGWGHWARWRTPIAASASALGVLPLAQIFTDTGWLVEVWISMALMLLPAVLLRVTREPRVWHVSLGIVLLIPWLTWRFAPHHAVGGVIPTRATWHDVGQLMTQLHHTSDAQVAPLHSTLAIRFMLCFVLAAVAVVIDLIAVVGHRGALAGVPLLIIYTISGAVPRQPVAWWLFVGAGVGFLLLLGLDARDELHRWGRLMPRAGAPRPVRTLGVSGQRIAAVAIVVAIVVPLVTPSHPRNLLANALHHGNSDGIGGFGAGHGTALSPYVSLRGELERSKPARIATVHVSQVPRDGIYYFRSNVLATYTGSGWIAAPSQTPTTPLARTSYDTEPAASPDARADSFTAQITIDRLIDNPPIFARPFSTSGLGGGAAWDADRQIVVGTTTHEHETYQEQVRQPDPTLPELDAAPGNYDPDLQRYLQLPDGVPKLVRDDVTSLTANKTTPYAKARALSDYFTTPTNGFSYSLQTVNGDSGSDLVDFLTNKQGFCQQFAGALAVMLRVANIPARVVLGYTHDDPDDSRSFSISTNNAHAWVEAYMNNVGWVPFDPTPYTTGLQGGATAKLPWAPHPTVNISGGASKVSGSVRPSPTASTQSSSAAPSAGGASHTGGTATWPLVLLVVAVVFVVVLLVPRAARWRRRRRRLASARHGDPDPLWAELRDTATDLGYVWSPARSPRQVVSWLGTEGVTATPLRSLASAIETSRYAPPRSADGRPLEAELRAVEADLRANRTRSARLRARFAPASLHWRWLHPRASRARSARRHR